MQDARRLRRIERALLYGVLGLAGEVVFTGSRDALLHERTPQLAGRSYLWMLPIYASSAYLFEPLHARLRRRGVVTRALAYGAGITAVELASGVLIERATGAVPWDYRPHARLARARGAVRLDYVPLWAAAGLALERVDDTLARVRVQRAAAPA